jgi:hypothetical protein
MYEGRDPVDEAQWNFLAPLMPGGCRGKRGPRADNRGLIDASSGWPVPVGAGATCRSDLAIPALSSGATIVWVERGVLQDLFDSLSHDGDFCMPQLFALISMPVAHAGKKGA